MLTKRKAGSRDDNENILDPRALRESDREGLGSTLGLVILRAELLAVRHAHGKDQGDVLSSLSSSDQSSFVIQYTNKYIQCNDDLHFYVTAVAKQSILHLSHVKFWICNVTNKMVACEQSLLWTAREWRSSAAS